MMISLWIRLPANELLLQYCNNNAYELWVVDDEGEKEKGVAKREHATAQPLINYQLL